MSNTAMFSEKTLDKSQIEALVGDQIMDLNLFVTASLGSQSLITQAFVQIYEITVRSLNVWIYSI